MHNHEGIELYREGNFGRNHGAEWNEIGGRQEAAKEIERALSESLQTAPLL